MPATSLPIERVLPELLSALRERSCAVLRAPTGAGKTTRVPPALLDAELAGDRAILMLEPRRLAARAAARRIAAERGWKVGGEVGFHVRFDRQASERTRILVLTEGLLVRYLQDDPFLERAGVVVFDEFHERNLDTDLALALVRKVRLEARPDLRIVVMSATIETEPIARFLAAANGPAPIVESEGRLHPVDVTYLGADERRPIHESLVPAIGRALDATKGDVLAFLPGVGEIRRTHEALEPLAKRRGILVVDLYGDLPAEEQDLALRTSDRRKVVLATNVAETSVTVEGVTAVVDSGLARVLRYDAGVGLDRLELTRISRSSAEQRAGRAGRTEPGICLRLWSEAEQRSMREREEPEIRRVDLAGPALQLLGFGERDLARFPWFEAPSPAALERATKLLEQLGALGPHGLTETGRAMARIPAHPRIARLLIQGEKLGVAREAALAAALIAERDPFARSRSAARHPNPSGAGFVQRGSRWSSDSDVVDRVRALGDFERTGRASGDLGELNTSAARFVLRARDELERHVSKREAPRSDSGRVDGSRDDGILRALLAAYPDRVARRRASGDPRGILVGGRGVKLGDESAVHDAELFVCVDLDAGTRGERAEAIVRQASAIERDWLPKDRVREEIAVTFDEKRKAVTAAKRTLYEDLVLEEAQTALPDSGEVERVLAEAAARDLAAALPLEEEETARFLTRLRCLREWMPELELPELDKAEITALLPELCAGARSFADLRKLPIAAVLRSKLTRAQSQALDREAPDRIQVPSGSQIALIYELGRPPVLAARIQELFGLADTPKIAGGRVSVLMHLLAPNHRPQQVTEDLRSFWNGAYASVRKELARRYPRHAWPEDPWNAPAERRPRRRR
jgi:ATP-dependent helicase HrpB